MTQDASHRDVRPVTEAPKPPVHTAVFGPTPPPGHGAGPLAALGLMLSFVIVGLVAAIIGVVGASFVGGGLASGDFENYMAENTLLTLMVFALVFFPSMALMSVIWGMRVEKRSLAAMGFSGGAAGARYLRGVAGGALIAFAMLFLTAGLVALLGIGEAEDTTLSPQFALLLRPDYLTMFAVAGVIVLIQSASEEIVCRGWMLSSLSARSGVGVAVLVSSLGFGLLHIDRALVGPLIGLAVVAGTATVGLAFSFWALRERGVYGVMGAHGGYNCTLILGALMALVLTGDGAPPGALFANMLESVNEDLAAPGAPVQILAQILVFGLLAFVLARGYHRAGDEKPSRAP